MPATWLEENCFHLDYNKFRNKKMHVVLGVWWTKRMSDN